ncbi:hypothetical protein PM8797T_24661 [Gimesia maris DSM 8797]|nr:hypothetical protein PM8797T_24661 [Gimesia maris DSM 8797]
MGDLIHWGVCSKLCFQGQVHTDIRTLKAKPDGENPFFFEPGSVGFEKSSVSLPVLRT